MKSIPKSTKGFTLIELMITISVFALIFSSTAIVFGDFLGERRLASEGHKMVQLLREARTNAVSGLQGSSWGLYFDPSSDPDRYVFFKGGSYVDRDASFDLEMVFPTTVTFSAIDFGGHEAVFEKRSGIANEGTLTLISDPDEFIISVNRLGIVNYDY
ncbi:prepilin-type N-terminal cleavage/methylation domain-containing protein [Candidatus Peregrinibacteria bacterium]|nr:prepilin-type N-terminal cleavage/methylation domain-containing protein [Candidatus Peregrinibacteria bacterium]